MKVIPFDPSVSSRQNFNVNLGELMCSFTFHWNSRVSSWYCDFSTTSGTNYSARIVEDRPILGAFNVTGLSGDFRCLKMSRDAADSISYDNFGTGWKLVYGTAEEWEEFNGV